MEKVYEELDEVKAANEKLRAKTELLENLKKVQNKQLIEIQEARSVIEKQGFESEEKAREISELKGTNDDLQRCLREKDSVLKRLNEANDKLRADGEEKHRGFEDERRKLVLALDEAGEKNIDLEQKSNVYRAEIEGLKGTLAVAEKKKIEAEKTVRALKEARGRDDVAVKLEEEKTQVEEKLKWKKEQFKHLEEAYEKLNNTFKSRKKEWEEERSTILDEIYSLQTKLDSQIRISEDLEKKLQMCNSVLTQEETRRKHLEVQVSELKSRYEDAFAGCRDARTQLDELVGKRDEEVAELRHSLSTKEAYFKEMKYENGKLELENRELLASLRELQEATIQGSGSSALSKLKSKFRNLENTHKNCSANLRSKESEWRSQLEKVAEEMNDYKSQLGSKEAAVNELELELENFHSSADKMRLQYEEISVMFLVLSRTVSEAQSRLVNVTDEQTKDERSKEKRCSILIEELEQKSVALARAHEETEAERERVACLLKRVETLDHFEEENLHMQKEVERYKQTVEESSKFQAQMKEKLKEAEIDFEEKLLQVCDALDNTNSDLVAEREKVVGLTRQIESFGVIKEKNLVMEKELQKHKEMLEESEKRRVVLEELERDSKENIRELCSKVDTAYAKLAEEVEKNVSLIRKIESIDQNEEQRQRELESYKERLEKATKSQILLQEKVVEVERHSKRKLAEVSEALEAANCELSDKTSEAYQLEFQLWVWKSIAKRLKVELEQDQNLRKRVEASLLEQVTLGDAMMQERNELVNKLKAAAMSDSEKEILIKIMREKDKNLEEVQREVELSQQESLTRELEGAVFAHITVERVLQNERDELETSLKSVSLLLEQKQNEATMVYKAWEKLAADKILTEVETEAKKLMIIELDEDISSISQKLERSDEYVSCFRAEVESKQGELKEVTTQLQERLRTLEADKTELDKQVASLSSERQELLCFISELENGMSKQCDEDTKLMKALDKTAQRCDGFGKENNSIGSPRLVMKHEDVAVEDSETTEEGHNARKVTVGSQCHKLLGMRDFTSARHLVKMNKQLGKDWQKLDQVEAICDVIIAAENRLPNGFMDYYGMLRATRFGPVVLDDFRRLMKLLDWRCNGLPSSQEAAQYAYQAWSMLSKPVMKARYDLDISSPMVGMVQLGFPEGSSFVPKEQNPNQDIGRGNDNKIFSLISLLLLQGFWSLYLYTTTKHSPPFVFYRSLLSLGVAMVLLQHLEQGMRPLSQRYNATTYSTTMGRNFFSSGTSSSNLFSSRGYSANAKPKSKTESKEVAAKKHSDAERRRRLRINYQFEALRTILPNLIKQDKASVLGETVRYFKELKKLVNEIPTTPSLEDSLRLGQCKNRDFARVVFSCSDREGLMSEVAESMKAADAKAVRAEMMTVGGRTKCVLFVQGVNGNEGLVKLKKALKPVVNRKPEATNNNNGVSLMLPQQQ
ncbi:BnaC03g61070D [Brassica napus]|uniref:BnaC03g61070D protein n=1 Tax=Brassica napus TaxID=3708 RepID=A0A078ISV3_BRANA|nr:Unknown [Brassica napus]CAA8391910.1 Unknown [Brassica napus]CAA8403528.1 Unknown [Brassica napus]CDY52514.1 BnaC03g61070D [Brassica napus]